MSVHCCKNGSHPLPSCAAFNSFTNDGSFLKEIAEKAPEVLEAHCGSSHKIHHLHIHHLHPYTTPYPTPCPHRSSPSLLLASVWIWLDLFFFLLPVPDHIWLTVVMVLCFEQSISPFYRRVVFHTQSPCLSNLPVLGSWSWSLDGKVFSKRTGCSVCLGFSNRTRNGWSDFMCCSWDPVRNLRMLGTRGWELWNRHPQHIAGRLPSCEWGAASVSWSSLTAEIAEPNPELGLCVTCRPLPWGIAATYENQIQVIGLNALPDRQYMTQVEKHTRCFLNVTIMQGIVLLVRMRLAIVQHPSVNIQSRFAM